MIGVWTTASRQTARIFDNNCQGRFFQAGPYVQVSRLANPLFNELLIPLAEKDYWNANFPVNDGSSPSTSLPRLWRHCSRVSTPTCLLTWPRTPSPEPTWRRSS